MLPNGVVVTYSYDAASRLASLTYTKGATTLGDLTYTYDKVGKRIATGGSFARTGLPQALNTATYDATNQQLTLGNKSATYDNNGNLTTLTDASGTTTYTWNARNRLVALSGPGLTASFQYDALGRRKQKTVNGTTTAFLYDGVDVVQELSGGTPTANLLTGLGVDELLMRTDASGARSALTDPLGGTVALADATGAVQTEYTYEPFGSTAVSGTSSPNAFQYTGRENDGTGLYYYRARYYHPGLQRFVSEDPLEFGGGDSNLYAYVGGNPISYSDPYGLRVGVIPPDPSKNTIICDGKGGIEIQLQPLNEKEEKCGIGECIRVHEEVHRQETLKQNKNVCKGMPRGLRIGMSDPERKTSEIKAYNAEIRCLKAKLKCGECPDECEDIIKDAIRDAERNRDRYR